MPHRPQVPPRLGIGPMSRRVVDATIRLAQRHDRPVMLVASRGQIECAELGGGYVEGWSTESFVEYVRAADPAGLVQVCRDHAGPWQHSSEADLDVADAMASSIVSLRADIAAGITFLHLDTSRQHDGEAELPDAVERMVTLYRECCRVAERHEATVAFEVGLERQAEAFEDPAVFQMKLKRILTALADESLPPPVFVVAQTGTKVVGIRNTGQLLSEPENATAAVTGLAQLCGEFGLLLKAHNGDYLPDDALAALIRSGAHAINIAPELGVAETLAFLSLVDHLGLAGERDEFLRLAHDSGGWRKWFPPGEGTDREHAIASGHYVFATAEFADLRQRVDVVARRRGECVDEVIAAALDQALERCAGPIWAAGSERPRWTG